MTTESAWCICVPIVAFCVAFIACVINCQEYASKLNELEHRKCLKLHELQTYHQLKATKIVVDGYWMPFANEE